MYLTGSSGKSQRAGRPEKELQREHWWAQYSSYQGLCYWCTIEHLSAPSMSPVRRCLHLLIMHVYPAAVEVSRGWASALGGWAEQVQGDHQPAESWDQPSEREARRGHSARGTASAVQTLTHLQWFCKNSQGKCKIFALCGVHGIVDNYSKYN